MSASMSVGSRVKVWAACAVYGQTGEVLAVVRPLVQVRLDSGRERWFAHMDLEVLQPAAAVAVEGGAQ